MKLFSPSSSVPDAERKLEQSKRQVRQQLDKAQSTLITTSSVLIVTGIAAFAGLWLARKKIAAATISTGAGLAVWSPVLASLVRFISERVTKRSRDDER